MSRYSIDLFIKLGKINKRFLFVMEKPEPPPSLRVVRRLLEVCRHLSRIKDVGPNSLSGVFGQYFETSVTRSTFVLEGL